MKRYQLTLSKLVMCSALLAFLAACQSTPRHVPGSVQISGIVKERLKFVESQVWSPQTAMLERYLWMDEMYAAGKYDELLVATQAILATDVSNLKANYFAAKAAEKLALPDATKYQNAVDQIVEFMTSDRDGQEFDTAYYSPNVAEADVVMALQNRKVLEHHVRRIRYSKMFLVVLAEDLTDGTQNYFYFDFTDALDSHASEALDKGWAKIRPYRNEVYDECVEKDRIPCLVGQGLEYEFGSKVVGKNYNKAVFYYQKARSQHRLAATRLGYIMHRVKGFWVNHEKIQALYQSAISKGYNQAHYRLGELMQEDYWSGHSMLAAETQYRKALDGGFYAAFDALAKLYENEEFSGYDLTKARAILEQAVVYDNEHFSDEWHSAMYQRLAEYYLDGKGGPADQVVACNYFNDADELDKERVDSDQLNECAEILAAHKAKPAPAQAPAATQ